MTRNQLVEHIFHKRSYLCVGLDTDIEKIPAVLQSFADPVFEFNKRIIEATRDLCVAYKINTAFYEANGVKGWQSLQKTVNYIPETHFKIADAKRGDIGNTSTQYAKAFFETLAFDAVTVAPYMGEDSIKPFLEYQDKWTIILGLTSNPGAMDFEMKKIISETDDFDEGVHITKHKTSFLYEMVLEKCSQWGTPSNTMFVVGATQPDEFTNIRRIAPENFFLVPGIGAQGGSLHDISANAMTEECGLLVNASRAIMYASADEDFAAQARVVAKNYQQEMSEFLLKS
jgi:orotidine-5'-phosphate decarboxylase